MSATRDLAAPAAARPVPEPASTKGRKVRVATMALGSTWRIMIVVSRTPSARAARTYSKLRARRNSARTTLIGHVHSKRSRMMSSHQKLGAMMLDRMMMM